MLHLNSYSVIALIVALIAPPVLANGNFQSLVLAGDLSKRMTLAVGFTNGSYSLSSIANTDKENKPCIGYGAPNPDHIMVLEQDFPKLKLQVNSNGQDTTLLVRGPNPDNIRCDFGTTNNKDATIEDTNWKAGRYQIWVGSIEAGQSWNYQLSVQAE